MPTIDPNDLPNRPGEEPTLATGPHTIDGEVFPLLEEHSSPQEQAQLRERIRSAEQLAPTHPHPHGPDSELGNILLGPFASMVDRVRDALEHWVMSDEHGGIRRP